IVYTAELAIRVDSPAAVADDVNALVAKDSGFTTGDVRDSDPTGSTATLTLRIPAKDFESALDELAGLGEELSRDVTAEDVQRDIADIDGLIDSKAASVDRIRDLMTDADDMDAIVSLEDELTTREGELASLEAQKRTMDDAVSYSTVTLSILSPEARDTVVDSGPDGFFEGLATGWSGFVSFLGGLVTVIGVLLPFLIALAIPGSLLWWYLRGRRTLRRRPAPLASATPATSDGTDQK
ncbi:MAG: DUF4349 domain-containing protein, partial [Stackebrandtia sp.]